MTHPPAPWWFWGQKVSGGPIPGNHWPFPKIIGIILPLISLWNYPAHKKTNHIIFWSCLSWFLRWLTLYLWNALLSKNKSHFLPITSSLNSFLTKRDLEFTRSILAKPARRIQDASASRLPCVSVAASPSAITLPLCCSLTTSLLLSTLISYSAGK